MTHKSKIKAKKQPIETSDDALLQFVFALTKIPFLCPKCNINLLATKGGGYCLSCKTIYPLPE